MSEKDPLEYQHRMDLELIKLGEQLQEHFNKQIEDKGRKLSIDDPVVSVTIASGYSAFLVDKIVIWSSDEDGWDPNLEGLIGAFETYVDSLAKHVRPGRVVGDAARGTAIELGSNKQLKDILVDMCHCAREILTSRAQKQSLTDALYKDLQHYTEQAESLIKPAVRK